MDISLTDLAEEEALIDREDWVSVTSDDSDDEDRVDEDAEQSAEDLADELLETQLQTTDDGHVRALVTDISQPAGADEITMTAEQPGGGTVEESFAKPDTWSDEFRFVEIVEQYGYDAGTLHHLEGERVVVDPEDEDQPFVIEKTPREELLDTASGVLATLLAVGITLLPVGFTMAVFYFVFQEVLAAVEKQAVGGAAATPPMPPVLEFVPFVFLFVIVSVVAMNVGPRRI